MIELLMMMTPLHDEGCCSGEEEVVAFVSVRLRQLVAIVPVSSALSELVAKRPVTSLNDMLVGVLAGQGPVAREVKAIAWCVALMRSWLLLWGMSCGFGLSSVRFGRLRRW